MTAPTPAIAWTIAGSDSGGGAGIQADLHTFQDFGVHGCSAITALTAQNSVKVAHILATPRASLTAQIDALASDLPASAIKLGLLASSDLVETVVDYLQNYRGFVVCDPVLQASSGANLLDDGGFELIKTRLLPRIDLLTPNVSEAEQLTGLTIATSLAMERAARALVTLGAKAVLLTGGHIEPIDGQRHDYFTDGDHGFWLAGEDIDNHNTHGSGCTLSAAIAAAVAAGHSLIDALVLAKAYVNQGIRLAQQLGAGPGPLAHRGWVTPLRDFPTLHHRAPRSTTEQMQPRFPDCGGALGLYPVVDSIEWMEKLLPLGVGAIQLRIKDPATAALPAQIEQAVALARRYSTRLFINDHWQLAIDKGAYGVHLGQSDLDDANLQAIDSAGLRLGVSTHSYYEIARAHGIRPSYIAIGPIYNTTTKVMKFAAQGLEHLSRWVTLLKPEYTLTAIGGINIERAPQVLATGVGSCAVVTAITEAEDYRIAVEQLQACHCSA